MSFNLDTEELNDWKEQMLAQPVSVDGDFCIGQNYPVEVKSAGDKGMGVFATRNIRRGEICCYYDGVITAGGVQATLVTGTHGFAQAIHNSSGKEIALAGFRTQLRHGGCAQMCNDASTTYTERNLEYLKHINVQDEQFGPKSMVFYSTKRIKKGQELLYSYGPDYWENKRNRMEDDRLDDGLEDVQTLFSYIVSAKRDCIKKRFLNEHEVSAEVANKADIAADLIEMYDTKGDNMHDYAKRWMVSDYVRRAQEN